MIDVTMKSKRTGLSVPPNNWNNGYTEEDVERYDLIPIDPKNPPNIIKSKKIVSIR